jgi:two-component system, NtrC family, sensor kinase
LWAYLLYAVAFAYALRTYIQYRSRALKEKNIVLEEKVHQRTEELESSLKELKSTQTQLIQKEKLASLGELTAGIAHEIQNPLNFVNNFSELSVDLAKELKEEIDKVEIPEKDKDYIGEILTDLSQNQEKINHHGKRASSIVKGMLEHSRASTGVKEMTDINALADEYFRLSYHGLRAKDKDFNATMETDFDKNLPKINVIPQDMGRVLLNLFNNAFYAVHERQQLSESLKLSENYTPSVFLTTQLIDNQIVIKVRDNGTGMPESVRAKVFQPFFTTKPTGSGTGLGLSLAYDIVTKGHGGNLEVISKENEFTEFMIKLPL